jgi:hypothetical protein
MAGWLQEQTRRHHVETAAGSAHHPGPAGLHTEDQRQPNRGKQAPGPSLPWVWILSKMMWILKASVMDPHWFQCGSGPHPRSQYGSVSRTAILLQPAKSAPLFRIRRIRMNQQAKN